MRENFCGDIHAGIAFSPDEEMAAFARMLLIRRFEEKTGQLYALGSIAGDCQLSIGQEAVAIGLDMASAAGDCFVSGPRCHGLLIARGAPIVNMMAELLGKPEGLCGGQAGSSAMSDRSRGFFGGHPDPGTAVTLASGLAFAQRHRGERGVAVAVIGDGAERQGQVYEALELATHLKLPLVLAIDNNATGETSGGGTSSDPIGALATALGIAAIKADGIDVRKVRASARRAFAAARGGDGPQILELQTYRYRGHDVPSSASRDAPSREEADPIAKSRARILSEKLASEDVLKSLERTARDEVSAAAARARQLSPTVPMCAPTAVA